MKARCGIPWRVLAGAVLWAVIAASAGAQTTATGEVFAVRPDDIRWDILRAEPPLARSMIHGAQDKPGPFTFRVRASAGHKLLPHTHPDDRTITVLQGTYWSAVGDAWDESRLIAYPQGTFYVMPAGVPHYSAVLEGETLFQESGTGPSRNDMLPQKR
jgi:quercetin dioxygenase-like cupin family protein